jgi:hypothetical protein
VSVFKVPGVDAMPSGASYNASTHQIVTNGGSTLNGWDLTQGGGVGIYCQTGDITVTNTKFKMGANASGIDPLYGASGCGNVTFEFNNVDGNNTTTSSGAMLDLTNQSGTATIEYNRFLNSSADYIDTNATAGAHTIVVKYNSFNTNGSAYPAAHPDLIQCFDSFASITVDVEFNTIMYDDALGYATQGLTFGDNFFVPTFLGITLANNTEVMLGTGTGLLGVHYFYSISMEQLATSAAANITSNYIDPTGLTPGFNLFNNGAPTSLGVFTASTTTTLMTVTGITSGNVATSSGQQGSLFGSPTPLTTGTRLVYPNGGSGTGGTGTYTITPSQSQGSETISLYYGPYALAPGTVTRSGNINMTNGVTIP